MTTSTSALCKTRSDEKSDFAIAVLHLALYDDPSLRLAIGPAIVKKRIGAA